MVDGLFTLTFVSGQTTRSRTAEDTAIPALVPGKLAFDRKTDMLICLDTAHQVRPT